MQRRIPILLTASACLGACATPVAVLDYYDMKADALSKVRGITIVEEQAISAGGYTDLGVVRGMSCQKHAGNDPRADTPEARQAAIDQVILRAAAKGAQYISAPQCDVRKFLDLTNNCWTTIRCKSRALKASAP